MWENPQQLGNAAVGLHAFITHFTRNSVRWPPSQGCSGTLRRRGDADRTSDAWFLIISCLSMPATAKLLLNSWLPLTFLSSPDIKEGAELISEWQMQAGTLSVSLKLDSVCFSACRSWLCRRCRRNTHRHRMMSRRFKEGVVLGPVSERPYI